MRKTITLLLFCALALVGCSSIDSGVITKRTYTAPYTTNDMYCAVYIKAQCTSYMTRTNHHSATWKFDLKNGDKTGWVYVNEGDYNKHEVGDCWAC